MIAERNVPENLTNRKKLLRIGIKGSDILIGDKLLKEPQNFAECSVIFRLFKIDESEIEGTSFPLYISRKLVELNNEVYDKLNRTCEDCKYFSRSGGEHPCISCHINVAGVNFERK